MQRAMFNNLSFQPWLVSLRTIINTLTFVVTLPWFGCATKETTTPSTTLPTLAATTSVTNITATSATSGGNISSDGGSTITARGVCYGKSTQPTLDLSSFTTNGSGTGQFGSSLTDLTQNTKYFVRAYATNAKGTAYGNEVSFTTQSGSVAVTAPEIATGSLSAITASGATWTGSLTSNGGATSGTKGVCWSLTNSVPTTTDFKSSDGAFTNGSFTASLSGLSFNRKYYVRSYATNSVSTVYGSTVLTFYTTSTLTIGQSFDGGKIAYILKPGDAAFVEGENHGLIVSASVGWTNTSLFVHSSSGSCSNIAKPLTPNLGYGEGPANTGIMTAWISTSCARSAEAARKCSDLVEGGKSDWFLPSRDELALIYPNKTLLGGFENWKYWTSNNLTIGSFPSGGVAIDFTNGAVSDDNYVAGYNNVRAVRLF